MTYTERYCRARTAEDKAATLIRIKREMVKNHTMMPPKTHLETLQAMGAMLEIDRQITSLGFDSEDN